MTNLIYLKDTYLFEDSAEALEFKETEKGLAIILDQTIFYPQGGGQPADYGEIIFDNDEIFEVSDVRIDQDGIVYHFGTFKNSKTNFTNLQNQKVQLKIDQKRRLINAKNHTAGHLIDIAIYEMGFQDLEPHKGFHFPEGPYCEFKGSVPNDPEERKTMARDLEKICAKLVETDLEIFAEELSPEEAKSRDITAPIGKSVRFVYFQNYEKLGMGCGGTHTKTTKEVGEIKIRQIKGKKGIVKVKYVVS